MLTLLANCARGSYREHVIEASCVCLETEVNSGKAGGLKALCKQLRRHLCTLLTSVEVCQSSFITGSTAGMHDSGTIPSLRLKLYAFGDFLRMRLFRVL